MMRNFLSVCVLILLTTACSKVPSQSSYSYSYQHKMQSANHWEQLANEVVSEQVVPFLKKSRSSTKIYIQENDRSDFGIAFNTYLFTRLFEKKIAVSDTYEEGAVVLKWSVQQVQHTGNRSNPMPIAGVIGFVGSVALEFVGVQSYYPYNKVPDSEILISTRLVDKNKTLSVNTETFYVEGRDAGNYWFIEENQQDIAYIKKGSTVCKDKQSLYATVNDDGLGMSSLSLHEALGDCAVMSKNYPVNIIDNDGKSIVFRSFGDKDSYVAATESAGNT